MSNLTPDQKKYYAKLVIYSSGGIGAVAGGLFAGFVWLFTPLDFESTLTIVAGGATFGSIIGIIIASNVGLIDIDKEQVKRAVQDAENERRGMFEEKKIKYNNEMSRFQRGEQTNMPIYPTY